MTTFSEVTRRINLFSETDYIKAATAVCSTLRKGPLLNPGFASIKATMLAISNASPITLHSHHEDSADTHPSQPPKDRTIEHFCLYMSSLRDGDEELLVPVSYYAKVTSKDYLTITRATPLLLAASKLESRLIRETRTGIDYKSDDMLFAVLFSMALSKALEPLLETPEDVTQITLPHKDGIFIGSACRNAMRPNGQFGASLYKITSASRTKNAKTQESLDPDFMITSKIVSFIRFRMMNPDQIALYRDLDELRQDQQFMTDLASSFETISRPLLYTADELTKRRKVFDKAVQRVAEIVATPVWRDACTLRKNYLNGHGKNLNNSPACNG